MNTKKKNNEGFTLVELIIVIAIIAILAVVLAPNLVKWIDKTRLSTDMSDCTELTSEMKTASISLQQAGTDVLATPGTPIEIKIDQNTKAGAYKAKLSADMQKELTEADKKWEDVQLKHKNKYDDKQKVTTGNDAFKEYIITVSDTDVSGAWTGAAGNNNQAAN